MTSQAKKLISNLKKEIEEINKKETITQTDLSNYNFKKSQLQFAEKLIKALKEDLTNRKPCPNEQPILSACYDQVIDDLNKLVAPSQRNS